MGEKIFLLDNETLLTIEETTYETEDKLQTYLEKHVDLLGAEQISSDAPPNFVLVKREMPISDTEDSEGRWSLDHLFIDEEGVLTLVEVKRSTDFRIRREVIGQLLEYAANADAYLSVSKIKKHGDEYWRQNAGGKTLDDILIQRFGLNPDDIEGYWKKVEDKLSRGFVRLIFAADKLPRELKRIIEYLNMQCERMEVLGLEIKLYSGDNKRVLVPRIIGQSEQALEKKSGEIRSKSRKWNVDDFISVCTDQIQDKAIIDNVVKPLYDFITKTSKINPWGSGVQTGSCSLKLKTESGFHRIFTIYSDGNMDINIGGVLKLTTDSTIAQFYKELVEKNHQVTLETKDCPSINIKGIENKEKIVETISETFSAVIKKLGELKIEVL